jgi:hypothetical protein
MVSHSNTKRYLIFKGGEFQWISPPFNLRVWVKEPKLG